MGLRAKQIILIWGIPNGWEPPEKMFSILNHQGNANQNNPEIPLHSSQNGYDQKLRWQQMLVRMWRKRNTPPLLVGLQAGTTTLESVWCFLRKLDIVLPEYPAIPFRGMYPEDAPTCNKETCSTRFIAAIFTIVRTWKEPRCPSSEE